MIVFYDSRNVKDEVYRGGQTGGGGVGAGCGWEAEGRLYHPQGDKLQCCVLSRAQKQLQ